MISHLFSICTPYMAPTSKYQSNEDLAYGPLPQFGYQVQYASGEVEQKCKSRDEIWKLLNGLFGGFGPGREFAFTPEKGVKFENLPKLRLTKLMNEKVSAAIDVS